MATNYFIGERFYLKWKSIYKKSKTKV